MWYAYAGDCVDALRESSAIYLSLSIGIVEKANTVLSSTAKSSSYRSTVIQDKHDSQITFDPDYTSQDFSASTIGKQRLSGIPALNWKLKFSYKPL